MPSYTPQRMPAQWKQVEKDEDIDKIRVTLPTIGGIAPTRYVPVLYAIAAFALVFFVLVLPGIRSYGSRVTVITAPFGASVYVDETRIGRSPVTSFVSAGTHKITVRFPGLEDVTETVEIQGRRIGSALFPRTQDISIAFDRGIAIEQIHSLIAEYHEWALGGRPGEQFQHPPLARIVSRAVWSQESQTDAISSEQIETFVDSLIAGTDATNLSDLLGGLGRIYTPRSAFGLAGIEAVVHKFIQLDNSSPYFSAIFDRWTDEVGRTYPLDRYSASAWSDERSGARATSLLAASIELDERAIPSADTVAVGASRFSVIPAGSYIVGYPLRNEEELGFPIQVSQPFLLLDHEVTNAEYALFLTAQPRWQPENREILVDEGIVDHDYLRDWPGDWRFRFVERSISDDQTDQPVRFVSWYAAAAYAEWYDERFADRISLAGSSYEIQLPHGVTWEYAAFLNALAPVDVHYNGDTPVGSRVGIPGAIGAYHLQGNLWEWTADWYSPTHPIVTAPIGAQRQVIGGSYANERLPTGATGGQPPHWCTPFLGFRLAAYPE